MQQPAKHERPLFPGELMAFYRKQRGWTQAGLAMRLYRSVQWVKAIESGRRPLDSLHTLTEVATVLGVPLRALLGTPLGPPPAGPDLPDPHGALAALEGVLLHHNGIHGLDGEDDRPARSVADLERDWLAAWELYGTATTMLSSTLARLPGLLWDAKHAAAHADGPAERRRAWLVLAGCYRLAAWVLWEYGELTLAWVAADRAVSAAEQADDTLAIAAGARAMQQVLLGHGRCEQLVALADAARRVLPGDRAMTREQLIAWGRVADIAMFAAARLQDREEYARWERAARLAADQLREDTALPGYGVHGPGLLAFRTAGALVELYEPKRAVEIAERLGDPADPLRYGQPWRVWRRIYQARAHFLRRQDDHALGLLLEAERVAPEVVRYAPREREILRAILRRRRTPVPAAVRALAVRLRVLPG